MSTVPKLDEPPTMVFSSSYDMRYVITSIPLPLLFSFARLPPLVTDVVYVEISNVLQANTYERLNMERE